MSLGSFPFITIMRPPDGLASGLRVFDPQQPLSVLKEPASRNMALNIDKEEE